eukprot:Phypoly_transcript_16941.p1 GENE.Phypoly_transcript_16941~~Phypoly_transcript_16941.p1  ORF type:complete len:146 (+),score=14.92 Phypoly_transcript_16941:167-604(+)
MTNCSRSNAAIAPKILKQVQSKLKGINYLFPGTLGCCIIHNGECLIETHPDSMGKKDVTDIICQLKNAAVKFGETLQEKDEFAIMHIQGNQYVFSLYVVDEQILAFYSQMDFATSSNMNFAAVDENMKTICQELLQLLHNTKITQ